MEAIKVERFESPTVNIDITAYPQNNQLNTNSPYRVFAVPQPSGLIAGVITAAMNPNVENYETKNEEALNDFVTKIHQYPILRASNLWVNNHYVSYLKYRHQNMLLSAVLLEICFDKNQISFYRAADSNAYIKTDDETVELFPHDMLTEKARKVFTTLLKKNKNVNSWDIQEEALNDLSLWRYPYIGLAQQPMFEVKRLPLDNIKEILLLGSFHDSDQSQLLVTDSEDISLLEKSGALEAFSYLKISRS